MSCNFMPSTLVRHFHVLHFQRPLLTYPCGILSMWAYVLWAFVRVGFCPDTVANSFIHSFIHIRLLAADRMQLSFILE